MVTQKKTYSFIFLEMHLPAGLASVFPLYGNMGMTCSSLSSQLYCWENVHNGPAVGPRLRDGDKQRSWAGGTPMNGRSHAESE